MKVVIASVIITLVFFIGAWLIVMHSGRHLLPRTHQDRQPHSSVTLPGVTVPGYGRRAA